MVGGTPGWATQWATEDEVGSSVEGWAGEWGGCTAGASAFRTAKAGSLTVLPMHTLAEDTPLTLIRAMVRGILTARRFNVKRR